MKAAGELHPRIRQPAAAISIAWTAHAALRSASRAALAQITAAAMLAAAWITIAPIASMS
jgi:hypothetical protein